jgi:hypothetical protein
MTDVDMKALIERVRNRPRYSKLTPEVLAGIPDGDLVLAITDHLRDHVFGASTESFMRAYDQLSVGMRSLHAIEVLDAEVKNGGFSQFFWNSSGRYAPQALDGLVLVGARMRSGLVRQAIELFLRQDGPALRRIGREDPKGAYLAFARRMDFRALDSAYYQLDRIEDLKKLLVAYVRAHTDEFVSG